MNLYVHSGADMLTEVTGDDARVMTVGRSEHIRLNLYARTDRAGWGLNNSRASLDTVKYSSCPICWTVFTYSHFAD